MTCSRDTDGDGNCGQPWCPECGPAFKEHLEAQRAQAAPEVMERTKKVCDDLRKIGRHEPESDGWSWEFVVDPKAQAAIELIEELFKVAAAAKVWRATGKALEADEWIDDGSHEWDAHEAGIEVLQRAVDDL